jgi:hypothetical protein
VNRVIDIDGSLPLRVPRVAAPIPMPGRANGAMEDEGAEDEDDGFVEVHIDSGYCNAQYLVPGCLLEKG